MRTMRETPQGSIDEREVTDGHSRMCQRKPAARMLGRLTTRQTEIVRLAQEGLRPVAIANALCLSVGTVRRTIADACLTFGVHGLPELVAEARRRNLLHVS